MMERPATGMEAVALGTAGGPVVARGRAGISTLVRVDDATYVIDCGMGSIRNYREVAEWSELRGIFLTHLHSDHIYDLGAYLVTGWQVPGESFSRPVQVMGPGAPSCLPALDAEHAARLADACGHRSLCGTEDAVRSLQATVYGADVIARMGDEGRSDLEEWVQAQDIPLLEKVVGADPVRQRHPSMAPFEVYTDELVRVTATLVDHRLCYPSYAFRFDSAYGSVVVSGDTAPSENLVRLARGADLLLHEVIEIDAMLETLPPSATRDGIEVHLRESHTPHTEVGAVAARAGVGRLVLTHVVPGHVDAVDPEYLIDVAHRSFAGDVHVASDLDVFGVQPSAMVAGS